MGSLNYREVTGFFTARIPDSGDADLNPDTVPLTGNVTFHPEYRKPLVFPGEHIVLEPINAIIIDGQLMGEVIQGEDVVLQALHLPVTMDERANQTWSWTMRFHGMTLGQYGETVELPDVRFVIEEGDGPLDLSTVPQTTARASSNFITRGVPGAGLQEITAADGEIVFSWDNGRTTAVSVPDAVPGAKGDPGDVRFEGIDPGITVRTDEVIIGDVAVPTTKGLPYTGYAWAGEPHASASIKYARGVEVARNLSPNPSFELSQSSGTNLPAGFRSGRSGFASIHGDWALYLTAEQDFAVVPHVSQEVPADGSRWAAIKIGNMRADMSGGRREATVVVRFGALVGGSWSYTGGMEYTTAGDGVEMVHVVEVPSDATSLRAVVYLYGPTTASLPKTGETYRTDGWHIALANTESDARSAVETYFDGDTIGGYELATPANDGFMSASDKSKLDHQRDFSLAEFGAVGDGIVDDTEAVQGALDSGRLLQWGDATYRVTGPLVMMADRPVVWKSDGASLVLDRADAIDQLLTISLAGNDLTISGGLHIDGGDAAFSGMTIRNDHDRGVDVLLDDVAVENFYRQSTAFLGGYGISIRGAFSTIKCHRPTVRNIRLAPGAGIQGAQGVAGVIVAASSGTRYPRGILIDSPEIDGVYSEDPDYIHDQDGIIVFAAEDVAGRNTPHETKFEIRGGMFRNCNGRAIKSQAEWGVVDGSKIYRNRPGSHGPPDIDFQVGGGTVSNVMAQYEGATPRAVVCFSSPATRGKIVPYGSVSGLRVLTTGEQVPREIVLLTLREHASAGVILRDIEVLGTQPHAVLRMAGLSGGKLTAVISDVVAAPSSCLVRSSGGDGDEWEGTLVASSCVNMGTAKPVHAGWDAGVVGVHEANNVSFL